MSSRSSSASVARVLQQFAQTSKHAGWMIENLADGIHADVYRVWSPDDQPSWRTHRAFAVKLYKPTLTPNHQFVLEQFESLSRLRAAVDGRIIDGWKIFAPAPLCLCRSPLALVMSMVPGRKLSLCLDAGDEASFAIMDSLPWVIVAAMERSWSLGQTHGDLNLDNILCDVSDRSVSFVDAGVPTPSLLGEDGIKCRHTASYDLGYLLYETGVKVKETFGNPSSRLRRQRFAESVLRAFLERISPFEDRQRQLDEIQACASAHLKSLDLSMSPRGMWHALVRIIASRRIDALLARLRTDARVASGPPALKTV